MTYTTKIFGFLIILYYMIGSSIACDYHPRDLDYDAAWKEGKFSGKALVDVNNLRAGGHKLSDPMKTLLASSLTLTNLRVLDLNDQGINDEFIEKISNNPTFSRITKIDLSGNPDITPKALEYIVESPYIGSIRDFPQISAKYGVYSSEIHIVAHGTSIDSETIRSYNMEPKNKSFIIHYLHPTTEKPTSQPAVRAIKWLLIDK
jgi:hypothetical protein